MLTVFSRLTGILNDLHCFRPIRFGVDLRHISRLMPQNDLGNVEPEVSSHPRSTIMPQLVWMPMRYAGLF